jgi:Flp pilus assembly protein TadG
MPRHCIIDSHAHCFSLFSVYSSTYLFSHQGVAQAVKVLSRAVSEAQRKGKEYLNSEELAAQCARALRNLSVNRKSTRPVLSCVPARIQSSCSHGLTFHSTLKNAHINANPVRIMVSTALNKVAIIRLGAVTHLQALTDIPNDRISQQVSRSIDV